MSEESKALFMEPPAKEEVVLNGVDKTTTKEEIKTVSMNGHLSAGPFLDIATAPLDGLDPQIYSSIVPIPPFSFLDIKMRKCTPKLPPPTYLKQNELIYSHKSTKAEIFKGFEVPTEGGLKCIDQDVLAKQKGVLASLIAQVATCFFQKGGFVRVSLPVRIFEARSTLDKIVDPWRTAPTYLSQAAMTTDPVLRMKQVITFAISGLHLAVTQLKPFNPLLGETLEGGFDDGTKIYCEHVSHHPPITSFLVHGAQNSYILSGRYNYKISFSANSLVGTQSGPNNIRFPDGGEVVFKLPGVKLTGLIMGVRLAFYTGTMRFWDKQNGIKAVVVLDCGNSGSIFGSRKKGSKRDDFEGLIYKYNSKTAKKKRKDIKKLADLNDVKEVISNISGSWLTHLNIGGEEFWHINSASPCGIWYSSWPLPSDWRFREDLLWLRRDNMPCADAWKIELEVQQRHDRELRERFKKESEKKAKKK